MKKTLLFAGLSALCMLVVGQKNLKASKSDRISEFKSRMYLSTSKDLLAVTQAKTIKAKELVARQLVAPKAIKKGNLKASNSVGPEIDTTYTYPWDAANQQWNTVPVAKMLSYYDAQHNLVQFTAFAWNYDSESWQDSVQFFYKYNDKSQVLDIVQQSWQFDGISNYSWVNVDHDIYTYNDLGQESQFTYQSWDYENNVWVDSWQNIFTYDLLGNNTLTLQNYWDAGSDQWLPSINSINKFDSLNHVTLNLMQAWDNSSNNWTDAFQTIYVYDSQGNNTSNLSQLWNSDMASWDNFLLQTLNYSKSNKIDNYLFQLWDSFLSEWYNSQCAFYKYDSIGNNICIIGQDYDRFSNTWSSSWENLYNYNAQNKQVSTSILYWDSGFGNWYSGAQTKNMALKKAVAVRQIVSSTALEVYPNPASEIVNIRNNKAIEQVQVFDILGNQALVENMNGSTAVQLNIANLKSGAYLLNIKDSNGVSQAKRIIKR